ncbi:MAG TPA: filamentous hemagglutinin N-terminal domain-containing protein, partial [Burkholderiales bacterium]|nr:filamentous hemagglutinin N-terminal domain-containing protein [Burkholderiales bacterium]
MRTQPRAAVLAVSAALMPWVWMQPALADPAANQLPTGGQVAAGTANISTAGSKMQIDQATDKAILNWQTFSIGSSAWVNFSQPSASSVALNKVLGNNPSEIFGRLSANGQVFLSNPSGVLFAPSASVDVGSLFATSLSITDQDFLAGRYNFYNSGSAGSVVNQGTIITTNGYAALAGPQ